MRERAAESSARRIKRRWGREREREKEDSPVRNGRDASRTATLRFRGAEIAEGECQGNGNSARDGKEVAAFGRDELSFKLLIRSTRTAPIPLETPLTPRECRGTSFRFDK